VPAAAALMPDIVDAAQLLEEREREEALRRVRERIAAEPASVDAARDGICLDCESAITPARRAAVPGATRCAPCQTRWERRPR
jgi:phage/conjugal plasmid C-4 type zinc finger TraR family protein